LALLALVLFSGPWLLSPYSKAAHNLAAPNDRAFQRWEHVADRLGSLPVFGAIWRGAERLSGNAGRKGAEDYRQWLREREGGQPTDSYLTIGIRVEANVLSRVRGGRPIASARTRPTPSRSRKPRR